MCARGQGRASPALLLASPRSRPRLGAAGDHSQPLEVPLGVGAAGGPGQRGWGTPSCWVVGDRFQGVQGVLIANPLGSSPQTVADLRHTFSQRLPAGVQGPQIGFGEPVTPPPKKSKAVCACTCSLWDREGLLLDQILRELCDPKVRNPSLGMQIFQRTVWPR